MQTIIQCREGSCYPKVKKVGAGTIQSSTSVRNAPEKIHVRILESM